MMLTLTTGVVGAKSATASRCSKLKDAFEFVVGREVNDEWRDFRFEKQ
jgi:hypothetical protein